MSNIIKRQCKTFLIAFIIILLTFTKLPENIRLQSLFQIHTRFLSNMSLPNEKILSNLTSSTKLEEPFTKIVTFPQESNEKISGNCSLECQIEERFAARRTLLLDSCKEIFGYQEPAETAYNAGPDIMTYAKKYNLVVCAIHKAGSSTMREHLTKINYLGQRNIKDVEIHLKKLLNLTAAEQILKSSHNVLVVRHPLDRLVSAYRDKIISNRNQMRNDINQFYHRSRGASLDLNLFFRYVLDVYYQPRRGMDLHWSSYDKICSVCSIPYQYIFKTETLKEDLLYLKNLLKIQEINIDIRKNAGKTKDYMQNMKYEDDYFDVEPCILQNILNLFALEIKMFDYHVPAKIIDITKKCEVK